MSTVRSIVCPVDFSDQSQRALRWAIALAAQWQSRLTVVTAVDPLLAHAARARLGVDLAKAETEPALHEFVTAVVPAGASWAPTPMLDVRVGDPSDVILEVADRQQADLIVLGTHGLGGFRKLLLGSTTERVLRRTRIPLLAVPMADRPAVVDPAGPQFNLKKVLAATDFSETSIGAVRWAVDVSRQLSVPLILVHVISPIVVPTRWLPYVDLADEERVTQSRQQLTKLFEDLHGGVPGEVVVSVGRPADLIASTAAEQGAGLIVMGLMGDAGAFAPRPGSIAYRVLSAAHVPVLVVTPAAAAVVNAPADTSR